MYVRGRFYVKRSFLGKRQQRRTVQKIDDVKARPARMRPRIRHCLRETENGVPQGLACKPVRFA